MCLPVDHGAFHKPLAAVFRLGGALGPRQVYQAQLAALHRITPSATASANTATSATPPSCCPFAYGLLAVGCPLLLHANLYNHKKECQENKRFRDSQWLP